MYVAMQHMVHVLCSELHIGRLTGVVLQLPYVEVELHGVRPGQNYTIVVYGNSSPFRPSAAFVAQVELHKSSNRTFFLKMHIC